MTSSRAEAVTTTLLSGVLALALLSPYLIWLTLIPRWGAPDPRWLGLVTRGLAQAAASTLAAGGAGWILFRALRALPAERRAAGELRLLISNAVPPLFLALALISLVTPFAAFPFGFVAVVVAHTLLYGGLVAVALERLERARLGQLAEAAWVMGVPEFEFWRRVAWPLLKRDLVTLAFFVFALALTSFSLPLLLQGSRNLSTEVAIYDLIRIDGRWDQAVLLAAVQMGLLFLASLGLPRAGAGSSVPEPRTLPYRGRRVTGAVTWLPAGILLAGSLGGIVNARVPADLAAVARATLTSLGLGATVGAVLIFLFSLVAFLLPNPKLERFLLGYLAPSPAITGFALLMVWPRPLGEAWQLLRTALALALLYFAPLYRWQIHAALRALDSQRRMAQTLSATRVGIWINIVWPQAATAFLTAAGLGAAWATGEFALSGILLERQITLPQLIAADVAHYRWGEAAFLLLPLGLTAAIPYGIYRRLGVYVRS